MKAQTPQSLALRGLIGTVAIALVVMLSLNFNRLPIVGNSDVIHAEFAEAAGIKGGASVMVSGAQVGKVRKVYLKGDKVVADLVLTNGDLKLGNLTRARIVTVTLLGRAAVELDPVGTGELKAGDVIPKSRTSSPYNLNSTLDELTSTAGAIDKEKLAEALKETSGALDGTKDDIGLALRGITAISETVADNDDQLRSLLDRASRVSEVLASRNQQIDTLLGSGQSLLQQLNARQDVVVALLASVKELSAQLRAVLNENKTTIGPALDQLDKVVTLLNQNKRSLQDSITGLRGYATAFGEAISSGPWFDAYVQNLTSPGTLAPIISGAIQ